MTTRAKPYSTAAEPSPLLLASGIRADWSDCQRQPVSANAAADPAEWAACLFHDPPRWVAAALSLRDRVVARLGLRPATSESFRVLAQDEHEAVVGSDDLHLDFRASVRCDDGAVDVTTVVQFHNALGRMYFVPVRLVHATMLRRMLRRAAARLDPAAAPSPDSGVALD